MSLAVSRDHLGSEADLLLNKGLDYGAPVELIFIRHGQAQRVDFDPDGADPALSELGRRQAAAMAEYLALEKIDAIWASPMKRAQETALAVSEALNLPIQTDERLSEFDRSHSAYHPPDPGSMTPEAIAKIMVAMKDPSFAAEVAQVVDHLIANHPGQRLAVVCHGGTVRQAFAHLLGFPDLIDQTLVDYTSISRFLISRNGMGALRSFNEAPWLRVGPLAGTSRG